MANEEPKQVLITEQDGAVDSILNYLKERIESPFLMSFLFSWSVINRDFLFYLFLSSDSNKNYQLASWDFAAFIFNFGQYSWYSAWADSFWYPLLSGVLMALLFSPISMLLSGCRYYLLSKVASFTQSNKSYFDLAHDTRLAQKKLNLIEKELLQKQAQRNDLERTIDKYKVNIGDVQNSLFLINLGNIAPFLIKAAQFDAKYKLGEYSEVSSQNSNELQPYCIVKIDISHIPDGSFMTSKNIQEVTFEGTVYDFFTDSKYFKLDSENGTESIKILIERLALNKAVRCTLGNDERATINLISCKAFNK